MAEHGFPTRRTHILPPDFDRIPQIMKDRPYWCFWREKKIPTRLADGMIQNGSIKAPSDWQNSMAIWRIEICKSEAFYRSHASVYNLIRDGLWTRPVRLGARAVSWPSEEFTAICKARIAGKSDDEIRALIDRLHSQRVEG
jgi:prophage regulatory protein